MDQPEEISGRPEQLTTDLTILAGPQVFATLARMDQLKGRSFVLFVIVVLDGGIWYFVSGGSG